MKIAIIFITTLKRIVTISLFFRISAIILLFTAISVYCLFTLEIIAGIGIYSGLFNITTISQIYNNSYQIISIINIPYELMRYNISLISNKIVLFGFSFSINFILLKVINSNFFGSEIKENMNKLLNLKIIFIYYFIFIFVFILLIKYHINIIHLDVNEVIVKGKISNVDVTVSADLLKEVLTKLGDAAVFSVGARLALALVSKQPIGTINKIGIFLGSGSTSTAIFRGVIINLPITNSNEVLENGVSASIQLNNVDLSTTIDYKVPNHPYLDLIFGTAGKISKEEIKTKFTCYDTESDQKIFISQEDLSPVLREVKKTQTDWGITESKDVVLSPLENNDNILTYIIDSLTDQFIINSVSVYLLFMLTLIFTCKLLINKNIEIKFLRKIKIFNIEIGTKINNLINWYITMWQKSSNFWIFYILIVLIISNTGSLYILYNVLIVLKRFI